MTKQERRNWTTQYQDLTGDYEIEIILELLKEHYPNREWRLKRQTDGKTSIQYRI